MDMKMLARVLNFEERGGAFERKGVSTLLLLLLWKPIGIYDELIKVLLLQTTGLLFHLLDAHSDIKCDYLSQQRYLNLSWSRCGRLLSSAKPNPPLAAKWRVIWVQKKQQRTRRGRRRCVIIVKVNWKLWEICVMMCGEEGVVWP